MRLYGSWGVHDTFSDASPVNLAPSSRMLCSDNVLDLRRLPAVWLLTVWPLLFLLVATDWFRRWPPRIESC